MSTSHLASKTLSSSYPIPWCLKNLLTNDFWSLKGGVLDAWRRCCEKNAKKIDCCWKPLLYFGSGQDQLLWLLEPPTSFLPELAETCPWVARLGRPFFDTRLNNSVGRILWNRNPVHRWNKQTRQCEGLLIINPVWMILRNSNSRQIPGREVLFYPWVAWETHFLQKQYFLVVDHYCWMGTQLFKPKHISEIECFILTRKISSLTGIISARVHYLLTTQFKFLPLRFFQLYKQKLFSLPWNVPLSNVPISSSAQLGRPTWSFFHPPASQSNWTTPVKYAHSHCHHPETEQMAPRK